MNTSYINLTNLTLNINNTGYVHVSTTIIFCLLMFLNLTFGTLLNLSFLITVYFNRKLRIQKYYGIISLCVVDLLVCSITSPLQLTRELISIDNKKSLPTLICSMITFFSTWTSLSSVFSLVLISMERYFLFRNNKHVNKFKYVILIYTLHGSTFLFALLNAVANSSLKTVIHLRCTNEHDILFLNRKIEKPVLFIVYRSIFLTLASLSFLIIIYCYTMIYRIIKNKRMLKERLNVGRSKSLSTTPSPSPANYSENSYDNNELKRRFLIKQRNVKYHSSFKHIKKANNFKLKRVKSWPSCTNTTTTMSFTDDSAQRTVRASFDGVNFYKRFHRLSMDVFVLNEDLTKKKLNNKSIENTAIKRTLTITLVFILFWHPFLIMQLLIAFLNENTFLLKNFNLISIAIGFCHSSINPIIYCGTNIELYNAVRLQLRRLFPFCNSLNVRKFSKSKTSNDLLLRSGRI